ncbi:secreted RxLR effector protein 161-like [Pyrus communis]|uniref:secreted RxLR effector protein 161-like n=1 Tax=Pyrus communis TaxID=23211 RepID=UPI0035BF95E5
MDGKPYTSLVGSLMYAHVCTRPDIAYAISMLGRFQSNHGNAHWTAAKKVLRYLQRTKKYLLVYKKGSGLELIGYNDSDFAGCLDSLKSTLGYIFTLANGAVSWKSVKQDTIATSTIQVEFVACYEGTSQAIWLRNFISSLKIMDSITKPVQIWCDNKAAIFYSKNNKRSSETKHLNTKYALIRKKVKSGELLRKLC